MATFRKKEPGELQHQLQKIELDLLEGEPLTPPQGSEMLNKDDTKLKSRMDAYTDLLRMQKKLEKAGGKDEQDPLLQKITRIKQWIKALNSLNLYIQTHGQEHETLKEEQLKVFRKIRDFFEQGGREGYVALPTGFGKTVIFVELIEALNLKTLIVVPTNILSGQTVEKLEEFAPDVDVGQIHAKAKQYGRDVTVITYASLLRQVKSGRILPYEIECLVLDEAHHSLSERQMETINRFSNAVKLGFTATPDFSKEKKLSKLLETEIIRIPIKECVEKKLLSPFRVGVVKTDVDLSEVDIDRHKGEFKESALREAVNIPRRNRSAIEVYKQNFMNHKAVAFCVGIEHAKTLAEMYREAGIPASCIHSKMSVEEKEEIIKSFKNGTIKVLTNADMLIEGFDDVEVDVALNLRPTRSAVLAEQRGGRVLRINKNNPFKFAHIIEWVDRNLEKPQILYSAVAGGTMMLPEGDPRAGTAEGGKEENIPSLILSGLEGMEIVSEVEEVLRITSDMAAKEIITEAPPEWQTAEELAKKLYVEPKQIKKV